MDRAERAFRPSSAEMGVSSNQLKMTSLYYKEDDTSERLMALNYDRVILPGYDIPITSLSRASSLMAICRFFILGGVIFLILSISRF